MTDSLISKVDAATDLDEDAKTLIKNGLGLQHAVLTMCEMHQRYVDAKVLSPLVSPPPPPKT